MTADRRMAIGELSRRTGCPIETIRYYERIGLTPAPARRGRYRSYDADDVSRLGFVRRARALGFSLEQVRVLLGVAHGGAPRCAAGRGLAASQLKSIRAHILDLRRVERALSDVVRACDGRQDDPGCPLIEMLDGPHKDAGGRVPAISGEIGV